MAATMAYILAVVARSASCHAHSCRERVLIFAIRDSRHAHTSANPSSYESHPAQLQLLSTSSSEQKEQKEQ